MVLGFVLYESVDLAVNVIKIGYNGFNGIYNWWYQIDQLEKIEKHKETKELISELKKLNYRVKELEDMLEISKIKQN